MKTITRKTLLYKTGVEYGDYTMNHVLGCSHGCLYPCYAYMMSKRFGKVCWLRFQLPAGVHTLISLWSRLGTRNCPQNEGVSTLDYLEKQGGHLWEFLGKGRQIRQRNR